MERHELEAVIYEKDGPIARIILNRREKPTRRPRRWCGKSPMHTMQVVGQAGDVAAWRQENIDLGYGSGPRQVASRRAEVAGAQARSAEPVLLPGPGQGSRPEWARFLSRATESARAEARERMGRIGPDDISDVIFTSGTTGTPKGVMLRHGATLRAYRAFNESFGVGEDDRVLIALPFFHASDTRRDGS